MEVRIMLWLLTFVGVICLDSYGGVTTFEVLLDTNRTTTKKLNWTTNIVLPNNLDPKNNGWNEVSTYIGESLLRIYDSCYNNGHNVNNWLRTPFIEVGHAKSLYVEMVFTMRKCLKHSNIASVETCRETFNLYSYEADRDFANNGMPSWDKTTYTLVDKISADVLGESASDIFLNNETRFIALNQNLHGIYFAFQDIGSCVALVTIKVFFKKCANHTQNYALFTETPTGPLRSSTELKEGVCVAHASEMSPPTLRCMSDGTWDIPQGGCQCDPGYKGMDGTKCLPGVDINDCYSHPCQRGTCVDGVNNYTCTCPHLYNGTNCENDISVYGCDVQPCLHSGTCTTGTFGARNYQCTCTSGYQGVTCAEDTDECSVWPGICNSGICYNNPGSYICSCPYGRAGPACQDIDECLSSPCKHGGTCQNQENMFTCLCAAGYTGSMCDVDITDCAGITCLGLNSDSMVRVNSYGYSGPNETLQATVNDAYLTSPNYSRNYDANMTYDYLVQTTYPNHIIILTVIDCDIESDKNGYCLYDFLYIYDGTNDTAPLIYTFCCPASNPNPSFVSTGDAIYLKFVTDERNEYRGFNIKYISDGPTTTTITTTTTTTPAPPNCGSLNIANGVTNGETFYGGIGLTVTCSLGYTVVGSNRVICENDTYWIDIPTCNPDCGTLTVTNGVTSGDTYYGGSGVTVTCDITYALVGTSPVTCSLAESWQNVPTCNTDCGTLTVINGVTSGDTYYGGSGVTVTCDSSNTLAGTSPATCDLSGSWQNVPTCNKADQIAKCFSCDDMTHLKYCDRVRACQSTDEVCYVQGYTISGDVKRYRSGCLHHTKCNTSTGHQGCTHCCSGNYCNTYGCGDTDLQTNTGRGPLCFDCKHSGEHDQCEIVNLCSSNQVCMVEKYNWGDDDTHFIMGCEEKQFCSNRRRSLDEPDESLSKYRRNIPVCSTCCESDFCNHNCTGDSQSSIPIIG